ncbi:uncharacterized protein LOC6737865 [Drosophila simulans]|uniref:uncharacterized protein LOC6737865 n=1 Tax=Drosophila simulans TaxID=7240 RepID=UPI001D1068E4|nr:uncharacterized protein LOC6737865 [Drosophila simulans]
MNGGFQRCQHTWCCQKTHPCISVRNKAMLGNGYRLGGSVGTDLKEGIRKFGKEAQGTSKIVSSSPCKFGKPKGQSPCKDTYTRNLITGKTCLNKVGSTSKSLANQGMQNPKSKSDLEQHQKALVKVNPKRRRERKKTPKRSTAGNIEQPLDDDGICMKNLFGSQLFQGNSNYQILKAVVPEGRIQKNSKLEWPLSFSMRPALPNPDLQSSSSSTKAITFTKKKGFRRGNKASPCETSTQTIEEESDPVLICLEQIRNQLAGKSSEGQEKILSRCFAEKSTIESSIQNERNEAGVENSKESSPNEPIEPEKDDKSDNSKPSNPQETASLGSFKNSSSRNSLNILPQPKSETNNKENKSTPTNTQAKSNADSSSVSTESQKKSEEKVEANSNRKDGDLKKPKETDKKTNFVCVPTPILKPHICLCRIPRVIPKFTRVMMPSTVCQPLFVNGCRMPKWQTHRQSNQHYCQCTILDHSAMVQVPFRMSSTEELGISQPKPLRKLGLNFTRLNTNQLQMAPATTRHLPLQTQRTKRTRNRNCNSSVGQMNGVFVLASSPSTRTDTAEQSTERRNRNLQNINYPGGSHSLSNNPPSSENRRKAPSHTSYPVLRRIQRNDSNNSQSRRFISVSSQYPEQLNMYYENQHRQDEYRTCNRNNSDQSHRDSHQNEERSHNSAKVGASGYSTDLTWTDLPPNSRLVAPNTSTDVETLETVTLMHPRKLRSCESAGNRNQANINENTVLIETTTPCNREILLQACGRPPCNSCPHHYTGLPPSLHQGFTKPPDHMLQPQISVSAPQNITPFDEGFLIDPRDQWMTTKSPASAPAMQHQFQMKEQCQPEHRSYHQFQEPVHNPEPSTSQPRNHGYNPQLKENIRMLPDGFYERTVHKYNITRMDSNFQPPEFSLQPDFLHGEQHPTFRQHSCPYSNQYHHPQLMMTPVPDPNRRYIPPQNQYPAEMFWPQQNVHLDYYDQSEYQI